MKRNCLIIACLLICCASAFATPADTTADNALSKKEMKDGWKLLFDGKSLDGWRPYKNMTGSSWKVTDGILCSMKTGDGPNPDLITSETYENFELAVDWKISPEGNSGIMYMVTEDHPATYQSGPEYQLIDDEGFPEKIEEYQKTGANYAMQAPAVKAYNPPGQWNHTIIKVDHGHVEHWLNGKLVVKYELWSDEWKKEKAAGKWKDEAGYGASKVGHIAFQAAHSNVVNTGICFKNVKIKILK